MFVQKSEKNTTTLVTDDAILELDSTDSDGELHTLKSIEKFIDVEIFLTLGHMK